MVRYFLEIEQDTTGCYYAGDLPTAQLVVVRQQPNPTGLDECGRRQLFIHERAVLPWNDTYEGPLVTFNLPELFEKYHKSEFSKY